MGIFRNTDYNAAIDALDTSYVFEEESGLNSSFMLTISDEMTGIYLEDYASGSTWQKMFDEYGIGARANDKDTFGITLNQWADCAQGLSKDYGKLVSDGIAGMDGDQLELTKDAVAEMGELSEVLRKDPTTQETPDKKVAGHIIDEIQKDPDAFIHTEHRFAKKVGEWMREELVLDPDTLHSYDPTTEDDMNEEQYLDMDEEDLGEHVQNRCTERAHKAIAAVTSMIPIDPHDMMASVVKNIPEFTDTAARNLFKDVVDTAKKGKLSYEDVSKKLIKC